MSTQYLIKTGPRMGRGMVNHDDRSWDYRAVDLIEGAPFLRRRSWIRGRPYDQGNDPHCVAFAGKGALNTKPMSAQAPYRLRSRYDTGEFYQGAQLHDEWDGEDYDGTSALGLCRYLASRGIISEYRWCFGIDDVLQTLSHIGPVMLGVWWYDSMFEADHHGFISPWGQRAGGHEVEIVGISPPTPTLDGYVTIVNSWGPRWGAGGRCYMRWGDLDLLLQQDGDAVVLLR